MMGEDLISSTFGKPQLLAVKKNIYTKICWGFFFAKIE